MKQVSMLRSSLWPNELQRAEFPWRLLQNYRGVVATPSRTEVLSSSQRLATLILQQPLRKQGKCIFTTTFLEFGSHVLLKFDGKLPAMP